MAILNSSYGTIDRDGYGNLGRLNFKRFTKLANPINTFKRTAILSNPIMATQMHKRSKALKGAFILQGIDDDSGLGKFSLKKMLDPREGIKRTKKVIKSKGFKKLAKGVVAAAAIYYGGGALLKAGKAGKLLKGANTLSKFGKKHKRGIANTAIVGAGAAVYESNAGDGNTSGTESVISAGGAPFSISDQSDYTGIAKAVGSGNRKSSGYSHTTDTDDGSGDGSGYTSGDDSTGQFGGSLDPKMLLIGGAILGGLYFIMKKGRK